MDPSLLCLAILLDEEFLLSLAPLPSLSSSPERSEETADCDKVGPLLSTIEAECLGVFGALVSEVLAELILDIDAFLTLLILRGVLYERVNGEYTYLVGGIYSG